MKRQFATTWIQCNLIIEVIDIKQALIDRTRSLKRESRNLMLRGLAVAMTKMRLFAEFLRLTA